LDIYHAGKRSYEFLSQLKLPAGNSPADRQAKKENTELAKKIALARAQELQANDYNVATDQAKKVLVLDWMKNYAASYAKAGIRVIKSVIGNFSRFLAERKLSGLTMKGFSESIAQQLRDRLKKGCIGEGAKSYYNRFRKIVKQAYRDRLLAKNPCEFIEPPRGEARIKDVLTFEELQLVANTETEAPEVKKAFLFCSLTMLRFVDVKTLTWDSINLEERYMRVKQAKTGKHLFYLDCCFSLGIPYDGAAKIIRIPSNVLNGI
jgi:integrase